MHIVGALFSALILFLVYYAQGKENKRVSDAHGGAPLTRGQRAYLRRKARRLGVDSADVSYRPRKR